MSTANVAYTWYIIYGTDRYNHIRTYTHTHHSAMQNLTAFFHYYIIICPARSRGIPDNDDAFWKQQFPYNMTLIFIVRIQSRERPVMINCQACYVVVIIITFGLACTYGGNNAFQPPQTWKLFYFPK